MILKKILETDSTALSDIAETSNGLWRVGENGVQRILASLDGKAEFIIFKNHISVLIASKFGQAAMYPLNDIDFKPPAIAVLMDLDGTTVKSEHFWVSILERTIAKLLSTSSFTFGQDDIPFLTGHSVSEHLHYCLRKYAPHHTLEEARATYNTLAKQELTLAGIGLGKQETFSPAPGLKEFLLSLKERNIKIGLVSSGVSQKVLPEILSVFHILRLGDPRKFYDVIITAGQHPVKGHMGTLGELSAKPHPWLYAEALRIGLNISPDQYHRVVGIEDSSAGVLSIRLAGFPALGINGGNIKVNGMNFLVHGLFDNLLETLPFILGE